MEISVAARNAAIDALTALFDAGPAAGYVEIRTGASPGIGSAATGTLLGTLPMSDPSFPAASAGSASANPITSDNDADASGAAGYFRAYDSTGTAVEDGTVSGTGGGGELQLDDVNIVAGGTINVTGWTINMPAS